MGACFSHPSHHLGAAAVDQKAATWKATGVAGLRHCAIRKLPSALIEVAGEIKTLDLEGNLIDALPDEFSAFTRLQKLNIAGNRLVHLTVEVSLPQELRALNASSNKVESITAFVGKLGKLEQLDLSRNKLTELPVTVGNLESLTTLKLAHNQLDDIPHTIGACKNLTYLDASHNRIGHLTSDVCQLTKLRTLVLDANSLTELPRDLFCKCKHLQTLSVHGCRIRPADLETMPAYEEFEKRRINKIDKVLDGGALLKKEGFDEGVDRVRVVRGMSR